MRSTRADLLETLERIRDLPILVIGDLILDRYIWGKVDRISPEAPVPVVEVRKTEDRLGGAANVARNLTGIGARVSVCGCIGDDKEGETILELLGAQKIEREGVLIDRGRPTSLKTRVIASSQQIVRIDREGREPLGAALREGFAAVVEAHLDAARAIILSDYGKGTIGEPLTKRLSEAALRGRIGLDSRPLVVDPHPSNYALYQNITIVKPNRKEAEAASGIAIVDRESAERAGRAMITRWNASMAVITLGEDGLMLLAQNAAPIFVDTVARQVFDVSGAGDTVTAILTAALAAGAKPTVAGDLANIGAGVVVSEVGTVSVSADRLRSEIDRLVTGA